MREPVILLLEEDRRTRRFIATVLKYAIRARVFEAAEGMGQSIDLLISSDPHLAYGLAAVHPSMTVLLLSLRWRPPRGIPPAWRFLSIPFETADFLDCIRLLLSRSGHKIHRPLHEEAFR